MLQATQIRAGMKIIFNDEPHVVLSAQHVTPGNLRGFVQTKLRNLKSGRGLEHRFSSSDRVERAIFETHELEYLYSSGAEHHFMNTQTYEQITINEELLSNAKFYLLPNIKFMIEFFDGRPVGVEPPKTIDLKVVDTPPTIKRATASASQKPATLETGLVVNVPSFIEAGDVIRIDTEDGKYVERAK